MEAFGDQDTQGIIFGLSGNGEAMVIVKASHKMGLAVEESFRDLVTPPNVRRLLVERVEAIVRVVSDSSICCCE